MREIRNSYTVGALQDALHYAIMSVGGNDKHGRESTMSGTSYPRWHYVPGVDTHTRDGDRKMTRDDWAATSRRAIERAGFPKPNKLRGEKLIRYVDRLAQAHGFDAYTGDPLDSPRYEGYVVANRKSPGRRGSGRKRHSMRRR